MPRANNKFSDKELKFSFRFNINDDNKFNACPNCQVRKTKYTANA